MDIFNSASRRKRSHGHRHYTSSIFHDVSLNDLLSLMQKPLGMHYIRSKLFSLPLSKLHALYNSCLVHHVTKPNSNEYKLTAIVLDIAGHRLFKPVGIFLKLSFANKGLYGINLGNILHHKSVKYKIPPYFKDQSGPIISYAYTIPIVSKNLITNTCFMIPILTISNLSLMIAPVQVPHSYIIRLATLSLVTLKLSTTPLYEMCSPKGLTIVSLNPQTGNITLKYLWILSRIMPDNEQNVKRRT